MPRTQQEIALRFDDLNREVEQAVEAVDAHITEEIT